MPTTVVIRDESLTGKTLRQLTLEVPTETITVSELIRSRVFQEVKDANARAASQAAGSEPQVEPTDVELALNGVRQPGPEPVDWRGQFDKAVEAFRSNRILILVDDQQMVALDEAIEIKPSTRISFLRLTMLMGG